MAKKTEWKKTKKCGHQTKWIKIERIQNRVDKNSGKKKIGVKQSGENSRVEKQRG